MSIQSPSIRTVFDHAVELASDSERQAYLDAVCATAPDIRSQVEGLLQAHGNAGGFLEAPVLSVTASLLNDSVVESPGTTIGPYTLVEQIGEGGFGVVFLAEQATPIRRKVALKIVKPGMDTRQVIARFEAERQALALMDHPGIAKVFDAGVTEQGRSYFVMELVAGVPINEYCDECNLPTRERLSLFIAVCQAVQHAHQKGIIHRDLKPTNVLVAMQDGRPVPKIIDFGVAKAIEQRLTEHTLTTGFAQMVGTPLYMSPEQAELSPMGVDTRSDIYSLGVLLYELLTGTTPFDRDRLYAASYDELRRIIREEDPPRPSARISTLAADLATTVAERRRTDTRRLRQTVHGDLDWIVMKCLEKDRNRRYDSAGSLARDMERYLNDEPVQACPPSAAYRFRKFARRNKTLLAAGIAIAAALVVGLGLSTWQYVRATTESARAKAVSDLLLEMLGSADAANAKGVDYKVRELLDDFSAGLGSQPTDQPEVEADIHATIGRAYRSVKQPGQAQPHFEKAIELQRRIDGPQSEKLAAILVDYAWNLQDQQKYAEAEAQLDKALKIYRQHSVTGVPLFHAWEILQHVLINAGRDADAERVTREALEVARRSGQEFADQANLLHRYADLKIRQGHFAEGEKLARRAADMHRRLHGDHHPETAFGLKTLARALAPQQKLADAEAAVREALTIFRRQFPDDHTNVRDTIYQLRAILEARGDKPALEALAKEEAEYAMRTGSPDYHIRLAELLTSKTMEAARTEEAHRQVREAIDAYGRVVVDSRDDFDGRVRALDGYATAIGPCAAARGFAGEVEELNRRLSAGLPKLLAAFPGSSECKGQTALIYRSWAFGLSYSSYLPTAEHALSESVKILEKLSLSDPKWPYVWYYLADTYIHLADVQRRSANPERAEAAYCRGLEIFDGHAAEIAANLHPNVALTVASDYVHAALFLSANHKDEQAAELISKAAPYAKYARNPAESVSILWAVAIGQLYLGDVAGYRATCKALSDLPIGAFDDLAKARAILTWCLASNALDDPTSTVQRAEEFAASNSLGHRHYSLFLVGAALYRNGQYVRAADVLKESIAAYPSYPVPGYDTINHQRLFLAMAKWQQGQRDEARRLLSEALPVVDEEIQSPSTWSHNRAVIEILRREAVALIEPKEAVEAVENKSHQKRTRTP